MIESAEAQARLLLEWYRRDHRSLPWRGNTDAYRVWVSETMLQQTRVEAVVPYYQRFIRRYPTPKALANSPLQEVLANWAGLGYYRRARMLHEAARIVQRDHGGTVPADYAALRALPGIGDYTASAVSSIAFDEPKAALDGNAYRVLARVADERRDLRAAAPKRALKALGQKLIEATLPGERGEFTQALMELGATQCVPRSPSCGECPWWSCCSGRAAGSAPHLPHKGLRQAIRRADLAALVVEREGEVLLRQRPPDASVMPSFWEVPTASDAQTALSQVGLTLAVPRVPLGKFVHAITDTSYTCAVFCVEGGDEVGDGLRWVSVQELETLPLTTISRKAIERCCEIVAKPRYD